MLDALKMLLIRFGVDSANSDAVAVFVLEVASYGGVCGGTRCSDTRSVRLSRRCTYRGISRHRRRGLPRQTSCNEGPG